MSKVKSRKSKPKQSKSKTNPTPKTPSKTYSKSKPLFQIPFISRIFMIFMFATTLFLFKKYALPLIITPPLSSPITYNTKYYFNETNFINNINIQFSSKSKKIIPNPSTIIKYNLNEIQLKTWTIHNFLDKNIANFIYNKLYNEFINKTKRNELYLFTTNNKHKKIRSNKNIKKRIKNQRIIANNGGFSYCKYEYKRNSKLYQSVLNSLNSSFVSNVISGIVKEKVYGVTDLFLSIFHKNNFLSPHDDLGLGHYAFIYFINKEWDSNNGGTLEFLCKNRRDICMVIKPEFNKMVMFKVYPEYVPHEVRMVKGDEPRMAATGWYYAKRDGVNWRNLKREIGYENI